MKQQSKSNVSIGKIGEPFYDEISDRVKYFSEKEYKDPTELNKDINEAFRLQIDKNATRMTMRAIITSECYASENFLTQFQLPDYFSIEAVIPLHTWDNHLLLYLANNNLDRICSEETLNKEQSLIEDVKNKEISQTLLQEGYSIERLDDSISLADAEQLAALYKQVFKEYMCEFTADSVHQLINNNLVYAARSPNDKLVSIAIAEISSIEINNKKLLMTELSDMATIAEFRGLGLNRFCVDKIMPQIKHFDIIYAEARACFYGSNKIFKNLGFEYAGRLIKHCLISSDKTIDEKGDYENLNVWYFKGGKE